MDMGAAAKIQSVDDRLSKRNFEALSRYIYDYSGIKMPISKVTMLEGRLRRRLRATGIHSLDAYCDYLFKNNGLARESTYLIDAVTTNKTDFFREPKHFEYMVSTALPELVKTHSRLRVWSSACSTGAEPYTMAMVLEEFKASGRDFDYQILATDLSTDVLQVARRGVYQRDIILPAVPMHMQRKYVMVSRDKTRTDLRISPRLRSKIGFARMNLMDESYPVGDPMQMIFCRNVLIYFDKPTQAKVLTRLCDCLMPGGYLFVGHSESVTGIPLPVKQVANTIFRKV